MLVQAWTEAALKVCLGCGAAVCLPWVRCYFRWNARATCDAVFLGAMWPHCCWWRWYLHRVGPRHRPCSRWVRCCLRFSVASMCWGQPTQPGLRLAPGARDGAGGVQQSAVAGLLCRGRRGAGWSSYGAQALFGDGAGRAGWLAGDLAPWQPTSARRPAKGRIIGPIQEKETMASVTKVILVGNLGRDPDARVSQWRPGCTTWRSPPPTSGRTSKPAKCAKPPNGTRGVQRPPG